MNSWNSSRMLRLYIRKGAKPEERIGKLYSHILISSPKIHLTVVTSIHFYFGIKYEKIILYLRSRH